MRFCVVYRMRPLHLMTLFVCIERAKAKPMPEWSTRFNSQCQLLAAICRELQDVNFTSEGWLWLSLGSRQGSLESYYHECVLRAIRDHNIVSRRWNSFYRRELNFHFGRESLPFSRTYFGRAEQGTCNGVLENLLPWFRME